MSQLRKKPWKDIDWEDIEDIDEEGEIERIPDEEPWPEVGQYYTPETKERD